MDEITPEASETIIEAAADGRVAAVHGTVGEALAALHTPADVSGHAPSLSATAGMTGRIARRTAVAASAAVLGLAGVAAAATGTIELLDPLLGGNDPVIGSAAQEEDEVREEATTTTTTTTLVIVVEEPETDVVAEDEESGDDESDGDETGIEGVDPSDGLDDAELVLVCDAAQNHGDYVSQVARDKKTETDGTHGERVREAAHSDCGKDIDDDESDDDESDDDESDVDESDDDESDDDESDDDESDDDDRPGNGHGNGNGHAKNKGKGHDNGNGNGHDDD